MNYRRTTDSSNFQLLLINLMPLDFISQSRIWSSEDLCSKETFAFGENHAVRLRKIPAVDRSSQSQSQSFSLPTCLVRVGPTGPCHWSFGNKWGGACILEYLSIYINWCAFAVPSSFPRLNPESSTHMSMWSMSGIFGKTKWMKVMMIWMTKWVQGCMPGSAAPFQSIWAAVYEIHWFWSLLGATSQLDNRTNGKMRNK